MAHAFDFEAMSPGAQMADVAAGVTKRCWLEKPS